VTKKKGCRDSEEWGGGSVEKDGGGEKATSKTGVKALKKRGAGVGGKKRRNDLPLA